jgi:endonuclease III
MRPEMGAMRDMVRRLISITGETYAEQSGIRLSDRPKPLFQLLTLALLVSKPIGADTAATAARQLFKAGLRTPRAVIDGDRATTIAALDRAGYGRHDESAAMRLRDIAVRVRDEFDGDLRNLAVRCGQDRDRALAELQRFNGIGPTGAAVFMREVQVAWAWARPFFRDRTLTPGALGDQLTSSHCD